MNQHFGNTWNIGVNYMGENNMRMRLDPNYGVNDMKDNEIPKCKSCHGTGLWAGKTKCIACNGTGKEKPFPKLTK